MKVNEIFLSIDGEGIRTGLPVTFIRLFGCNLKCPYCDTKYACFGDDYREMSIAEIIETVKSLDCPNITLTGGEPLMNKEAYELIDALINEAHCQVNIETNGSIDVSNIRNKYSTDQLIITMDYKTHNTGMSSLMNRRYWNDLAETDVLKFVVHNQAELEQMEAMLAEIEPKCTVYVSPVFGLIEPKDIVDFVIKSHYLRNINIRVQVQLHKIIWDPQKRGV